jgi:hypothetical protein
MKFSWVSPAVRPLKLTNVFHFLQVVVVVLQVCEIFLAFIEASSQHMSSNTRTEIKDKPASYPLANGHFFLHAQVFKSLSREAGLAKFDATNRARLRAQGEEAVYTRLAHLVVAFIDEQSELRVDVAIRLHQVVNACQQSEVQLTLQIGHLSFSLMNSLHT